MRTRLFLSAHTRIPERLVLALGTAAIACAMVVASDVPTHTFDPKQIQISLNPDLDIVYHTLAHLALPGDPSNLYSKDYIEQIQQAKKDLEVGQTKLDQLQSALETNYRAARIAFSEPGALHGG